MAANREPAFLYEIPARAMNGENLEYFLNLTATQVG